MAFMITLIGSLLTIALTASDTLLTLSRSNSCLKDLVAEFVRADDCAQLNDRAKSKLAMMMTECLLLSMNKPFPPQCKDYNCHLQGDAWSTFTTFFAHVDNLCHFYWETLHHERAQSLIGKLTESSSKAEQTLRENAMETHAILTMQQKMHSSLDESLKSQERMSALLNSSAVHLTNLTIQIQTFVESIHKDIDANYASIRNLLGIINEGLKQVVEFQGYIRADITSVSGMLFFISQFLIVLFVTSHQKYQEARMRIILVLLTQAAIELCFPSLIYSFIGIRCYRYIFIAIKIMQLKGCSPEHQKPETALYNSLSTPRLERVFRKIADQRNHIEDKELTLSHLAVKVLKKLNRNGRGGGELESGQE